MVELLPTWARGLVAVIAVLTLAAITVRYWPDASTDGYVDVTVQGASVSDDGREILVNLNACTTDARVMLTAENASEIRLRSEAFNPSETESCGYSDLVRLDAPLAGRKVVDEVSGEAVVVRANP